MSRVAAAAGFEQITKLTSKLWDDSTNRFDPGMFMEALANFSDMDGNTPEFSEKPKG